VSGLGPAQDKEKARQFVQKKKKREVKNMEQKHKVKNEDDRVKKGQCPHCKAELEIKKEADLSCRYCGKELDESQFWLE
jgi:hypothetical protein